MTGGDGPDVVLLTEREAEQARLCKVLPRIRAVHWTAFSMRGSQTHLVSEHDPTRTLCHVELPLPPIAVHSGESGDGLCLRCEALAIVLRTHGTLYGRRVHSHGRRKKV